MLKNSCLWLFALCAYTASAQHIVNEKYINYLATPGAFSTIKMNGALEVWLSQSDTYSVATAAGSAEELKRIVVEVKDNELILSNTGSSSGNSGSRVYLGFKNLTEISLNGAVTVHIVGSINLPKLKIETNGAAKIDGPVFVDLLKAEVSGAGQINLTGKSASADIKATGASKFLGTDFSIIKATVNASGAAKVTVRVVDVLDVKAAGAAQVLYHKPAVINKTLFGAAKAVEIDN